MKWQLIFPPSIIEKHLRGFGSYSILVNKFAPVYLAGIIEYLCAEILHVTIDNLGSNHQRILVKDMELGILNDIELSKLFKKFFF